jgi:hypothetical protein
MCQVSTHCNLKRTERKLYHFNVMCLMDVFWISPEGFSEGQAVLHLKGVVPE